jgi:hypothetical protein
MAKYQCPVCNKVSGDPMDLTRHMLGRGDKIHREWIESKGFKYSQVLRDQLQSFGNKGYGPLAKVIDKECKAQP